MNFNNTDIFLIHNDLGASRKGASQGPQKIWDALLTQHGDFKRFETFHFTPNQTPIDGEDTLAFAKNIFSLSQIMQEISESIKASLQSQRKAFVISGDHSTAAASVAGIKKAHPDKRIGIVWFDAHADIHSPHTTPSGNMHGMPLAIVTDQDNTLNRINEISDREHQAWEKLQQIGVISPCALAKDIAYLGVRDTEKPEDKLIQSQGSLILSTKFIHDNETEAIYNKIQQHLKDCDLWYVSFDIDCLDEEIVPGTGTPVSDGLELKKSADLLQRVCKDPKSICVEISEFNPLLDEQEKTKSLTTKLALETLTTVAN